MYQFSFMNRARCNALKQKESPRLMQDVPSDKPKSALHLTILNDYYKIAPTVRDLVAKNYNVAHYC
jgi:hypothetical protein